MKEINRIIRRNNKRQNLQISLQILYHKTLLKNNKQIQNSNKQKTITKIKPNIIKEFNKRKNSYLFKKILTNNNLQLNIIKKITPDLKS